MRLGPSDTLRAQRVVAIIRATDGRHLRGVCSTLIDAGVSVLEVTTNTPGAAQVVSELAARGLEVGMGTVRTVEHVRRAVDAGASFVVCPGLSLPVGEEAQRSGLRWYPGAMTPTEIHAAWDAGASAVKVFPVARLGGAGYIRDVRAPLDDIPLIPTGGVGVHDIGDYLAAGALAVGIGSPLLGDALVSGDLAALRSRADAILQATAAGAA